MTQKTKPSQDTQAPAGTPPVDPWHGVGGEYVVVNGVRTRVGGPPLPPVPPAEQG